jgi:hypothetical protein
MPKGKLKRQPNGDIMKTVGEAKHIAQDWVEAEAPNNSATPS